MTPRHILRQRPHAQRGAALLIAMIVVTLIASLASSIVWQQWRATQIEIAERARAQSTWMLKGALDWARLILREDARPRPPDPPIDHLGEPWALPLEEARLSTFLAADKDNTDDAPDVFLSGRISDAQSHYNLTNLIDQGKVTPAERQVLERLCQSAGVSTDVATRIGDGLRDAMVPPAAGTSGAATAPLLPRSVSQLNWLGIDPASVRQLEPFVTLLPVRTPVNANTAPREVLAAVIPGLDLASAERLVQLRQRQPFKTLADIQAQVPGAPALKPEQLSVSSSFFVVRGRLRMEDRVLEQFSLVERRGLDVIALQREIVSSREGAQAPP